MLRRCLIINASIALLIFHEPVASELIYIPRGYVASNRVATINRYERVLDEVSKMALSSRGGGDMSSKDKALAGATVFLILDTTFRKIFRACDIKFPSQLGGCIILFNFLLLSELMIPGMGDNVYKALTPGANLLTNWLPVFFVPGLAILPLAPSIGSAWDHILVLTVVILGFYYTSSTVAYSVLSMRRSILSKTVTTQLPHKSEVTTKSKKPFLDSTLSTLLKISIISAATSLAATRSRYKHASSLQAIFHFTTTLAAYVWGALLPNGFTKFIHPLVTCTVLTWILIQLTALSTGSTFKKILSSYCVGSLHWSDSGAGDHLLNFLGPSVVSFAIAMYSRKRLLKENLFIIITSMLISAGGGLFGTAAFVRAINLGGTNGALVRLSVLSRNVTAALAMVVTSILNGNISITASVVVLTGIFAATFGRSILDSFGIKDPVARGLAIGSAGQGLGVASMTLEPDAFPFAAMSMVLTAVCATTLVSIPIVKKMVVNLATGS